MDTRFARGVFGKSCHARVDRQHHHPSYRRPVTRPAAPGIHHPTHPQHPELLQPSEIPGRPRQVHRPRLFLDEDEIFGKCDFRSKGIHAASFNSRSLGIEVLGDYDIEDPHSGRGLACCKNTAETVRLLLTWLGIKKSKTTILFHRYDPKKTKSSPSKRIDKTWFLDLIPPDIEEPAANDSPYGKPDVGIP